MTDTCPEPGLVIPYYYLWRREHESGEESGRKMRPCVMVVVLTRQVSGKTVVAVAPITSQAPDASRSAVEVPRKVKAHLQLDAAASWIVCDEYNEFEWPGVDLAVTPGGERHYGFVPDPLLDLVRREMRAAAARHALKPVKRGD